MTATFGEVAVSSTANARPATIGMPSVSKKSHADGVVGLGLVPARVKRFALRQDVRLQTLAGQIRSLCAGHGHDAGNRRDRLLHALMERDVGAGGIAILRQDDLREQQMVGAESGIDGAESGERANEEPGADHQECGQRDLKSDDGLVRSCLCA